MSPGNNLKVRSLLGETPLLTDCRQLGEAAPAAIKPGAYVTVVGQGERGAVTFHPESLTYSVRLGKYCSTAARTRCMRKHESKGIVNNDDDDSR